MGGLRLESTRVDRRPDWVPNGEVSTPDARLRVEFSVPPYEANNVFLIAVVVPDGTIAQLSTLNA